MNPKPTLSTSAASGGIAGAIVVLLQWALSFWHVSLPADVGAAVLVVIAPLLHWSMTRWGVSDSVPATPETK